MKRLTLGGTVSLNKYMIVKHLGCGDLSIPFETLNRNIGFLNIFFEMNRVPRETLNQNGIALFDF